MEQSHHNEAKTSGEKNFGKKKNGADLERDYKDSETVDQEIFSEMRSNVLLVAGDHYTKRGSKFWERIRDTKQLDKNQKLRLTKNHVKKILNSYISNMLAHAPNTTIVPHNEDEIQDQKTAELNKYVWDGLKRKMKFRKKVRKCAQDFCEFGEVFVKSFFDPEAGEVAGYNQLIDGESGQPVFDEEGNPIPDKDSPVMEGAIVNEVFPAFNVLRDPEARNMDESPYLIFRKMVSKAKIKSMVRDQKVLNAIENQEEEEYLVFDGDRAKYGRERSKFMLREHYFRPSKEYPNGYYYFCVQGVIITEGELPYGIWPIRYAGFDEISTSARHRSPIKQMRPYQIEINRAASGIATAQVTLGDDKLVLSHGSKLSHGGSVPGVRALTVTGGGEPTVLGGRDGSQYLPYMQSQISELYTVMNVVEDDSIAEKGQLDPYAKLYASMKNKKKFSKYGEVFEEFIVDLTELNLEIARLYLDENTILNYVGRSERVNLPEFFHQDKNCYRIKVEPVGEDIDTMMGRQMAINHTLQYVGNSLEKEDIGRMMKAMPFMNYDEAFGDFTIDYDNAKNDILAMERGEEPMINQYDNHTFLIQRVVNRIKKPDFKFLDPNIQDLFGKYIKIHEQQEVEQQMRIQRAQQGFIPTDGYLVTVDFYVSTAEGKTKRARLPQKSVEWLIQQMELQGQTLDKLEKMNQGVLSDMAGQLLSKNGQASPQ